MPSPIHGTPVAAVDEIESEEMRRPAPLAKGTHNDSRPGWVKREIEQRRLERLAFFRSIAERQERARETGTQVKLARRWFGPSFVAGE